jgi:hypothetical protein
LRVSVAVAVQTPAQSVWPAGHWHAPPTQLWPPVHVLPHIPQCVLLVARGTSQPLAMTRSQSAKPAAHDPIPHIPTLHPELALGSDAHTRPHAPQLRGSFAMLVSQPSPALPLQSAKPALHVPMPHAPPMHPAVALAGLEHGALHEPQWLTLVSVLTSQPSAEFMLQSANGRAHVPTPHTPALHAAAPPGGTGHALPQRLQLSMSVLRLVSQPLRGLPSQSAKPGLQRTSRHAPIAQSLTALARLHARPQAPQCASVVRVSTSQPLSSLPSQSAKPAAHCDAHVPIRHAATAFAPDVQRFPQAPQLLTSELSVDSHPLELALSQLAKPALHAREHAPAAQRGAALSALAQRVAHAPQLFTSSAIDCSQPLALVPSQLAKPALHAIAQVPDEHAGAALAAGMQRVAHVPQLSALRLVSASQPLAALLSQSPKLPEQRPTAHRPIVHVGSALATVQPIPHPPQLAGLLCVSMHASVQHVWPMAHGCVAEQPITHRLPRHTLPAGQFMSVTQGTHVCVIRLQRGVSPEHASSREHPGAHCPVRVSQN